MNVSPMQNRQKPKYLMVLLQSKITELLGLVFTTGPAMSDMNYSITRRCFKSFHLLLYESL